MKLSQLEMLVHLAETGSVQGVAERMHRTQAAVSMALRNLEEDVGFTLFDRSGYRLTLSSRGKQFLRQAREVVKQQQRLQSLAQQLETGAEPQLRITYDHTCAPGVLFPAIQQVQRAFPATELLLSGDSQLRGLRKVREGEAELALCPWLPIFRQYGDFETAGVRAFELLVVCTPNLLASLGKDVLQRHDLLELPMLIPQDQDVGIDLDKIIRMPGQQRIRVNDSITQRELLLAGMGWGIIPGDLVGDAIKRKALQRIDIPGFMTQVNLEVHLVRSAEHIAGPAEELIWRQFS
ncbi:LysR family transcriptional regulator [Pseudidiomarina insulisalsae]|uniref:LysR family transcriptional regulator n=1 Tax=Pseudidiomarina insulisalsae TaxID=575789 RepID=A0A432YNP4_9GAMM|nr:LysR family transcriptional regulator [Pseudidiomarina insulisalsae]RUO62512.1 LysR family transcriptional regulator [Pseudidiomarina insulisalsae]